MMRTTLLLVITVVMSLANGAVFAQESEPVKELTKGLLDLLDAPDTGGTTDKPNSTELTPADVGLDGEDLGERSEDPLQAVRQSMLIAAGFLERGQTNDDTQQLQQDILTRLDEIIDELEPHRRGPYAGAVGYVDFSGNINPRT